jgi:hypothetical protein
LVTLPADGLALPDELPPQAATSTNVEHAPANRVITRAAMVSSSHGVISTVRRPG